MQLAVVPPAYRWVVLGVVWSSNMVVFLARMSIGPLAPFLKESFTLSNTEIGSLVSASTMLHLPTLIVGGWLVDRIGVRRLLIAGTTIICLCTAGLFMVTSYQAMLILMMLSGLGSGCLPPAAVKAVVTWFPVKERATAMGLNQTAINISGIVGAALLPTVAIVLGWRYGFLFVSLSTLVFCISAAIFYRNPPQLELSPVGDTAVKAATRRSNTHSMLELFKTRDIWITPTVGFFLAAVEFAAMTHLVVYLKESLFFSAVVAGGLLAMTEASGALGKPASGLISDRLLGGRRKPVIILMGVSAGIACLVLGLGGNGIGWVLYPTLAMLGMMSIGWAGMVGTLTAELAGKELAGLAYGVGAAIWVAGIVVGPPLFGYVADRTGSFQTSWLVMALCSGLSVVAASLIREHKKRI